MPDITTPFSSSLSRAALVALVATFAALLPPASPAEAAPLAVAPPEIVPFEQWAPSACPRPPGEEPAPVRRLVVHHTHEPVAHTPEQVLPALALTCKAHTDRGFSTIGYHYVVDPWGGIWQGRGGMPDEGGRPPATQAQGAHVAGSNAGAVGVVFLGDHADAPPTAAALTAATQLLAWLIQDTGIDPGAKVASNSSGVGTARFTGAFEPRAVTGHSASNHTECPGEHLAGQQVSGWDGLAAPAAVQADAAPAEAAGATAAPAAGQEPTGAAAAAPTARGNNAPTLSLPKGLVPLVSPVERVAGSLRSSGLLSLAERLIDSDR